MELKVWWSDRQREFGDEPGLVGENFVEQTMGVWNFCGCGDPWDVIDSMIAYMKYVTDRDSDADGEGREKRHAAILTSPAFYFCGYLADVAKWTDHGATVRGAWANDAGLAWLADADKEKGVWRG